WPDLTGGAGMDSELAGKSLELLKQIVRRLTRVAFMTYSLSPLSPGHVSEAQKAVAPALTTWPGRCARARGRPAAIPPRKPSGSGSDVRSPARREALVVGWTALGS